MAEHHTTATSSTSPENPGLEKKVPPMKPSFKLQLDKVNQHQPSPVKEADVELDGDKKSDEGIPDQVSTLARIIS